MPALEFSGTFRLVLFAILPVMMVWRGRYAQGQKPWVFGGKLLLVGMTLLAVTVMAVEWGSKLGLFVI